MSQIDHANAFESSIAGIPCLIEITSFLDVPPNPSCWDSADDYYGYTEIEWEVYDRKGYKAAWLERKLTQEMSAEIDDQAIRVAKANAADCFDEPDYDFYDCPY